MHEENNRNFVDVESNVPWELTREFYSNLHDEGENMQIRMHGIDVDFSANAINKHIELHEFSEEEEAEMLELLDFFDKGQGGSQGGSKVYQPNFFRGKSFTWG